MKTKIKILIVSFVIAAAAVMGFNLAQESSNMDVSLADIATMAKAAGESGWPCWQSIRSYDMIGDCEEVREQCIEGFEYSACSSYLCLYCPGSPPTCDYEHNDCP